MTHDASDHVDTADARSAVLQVLAVGATTTVVLAPGAMAVGISLIFLGYFGAAGYFGALLGAVVLFVILYVIGTAFHDASPLTRSTGRRFLWAALLTIAGTGLAFYGYSVLRDIGWDPARPPSLGYLLAGVAFALVTAVLTHHRVFRVSAMAVITLFVGSTALVATVEQRGDDIANRLAAYGTEADLVFVTEITDYGRGRAPHANVAAPYTMKYAPLDGPADAEISVWATRGRSYQCPQDPPPRSDDMGVRCVEEAVGLASVPRMVYLGERCARRS